MDGGNTALLLRSPVKMPLGLCTTISSCAVSGGLLQTLPQLQSLLAYAGALAWDPFQVLSLLPILSVKQ